MGPAAARDLTNRLNALVRAVKKLDGVMDYLDLSHQEVAALEATIDAAVSALAKAASRGESQRPPDEEDDP